MTIHPAIDRLIATSIDFPLGPSDHNDLEAHLAGCAACRDLQARYQRDASRLRAIAFVEPPEQVRIAIVGAASRRAARAINPLHLLLAAALLMIGLLGVAVAAGAILRQAAPAGAIGWTAVPAGPALVDETGSLHLEAVAASDSTFYAIGSGSIGAVVLTSADGDHWAPVADRSAFGDATLLDVAAGGGQVVISGSHAGHPAIWRSSDGMAWSLEDLTSEPGSARSVATDGARIVIVGSIAVHDAKGTSGVPATWLVDSAGLARRTPIDGTLTGGELTIAGWAGDRFIAMNRDEVLTSVDGTAWKRGSAAVPTGAQTVVVGGGRIVALGSADGKPQAWTSDDGSVWTDVPFPAGSAGQITAAAALGDRVVAVGSDRGGAATWTSDDGIRWIAGGAIDGREGALMLDVVWRGTEIVAVGGLGSRAAIWTGTAGDR